MEQNEVEKPLKVGTLKCPKCKLPLHFKLYNGMRIIEDGLLEAYCPTDKAYFKVKPNN